jgi:hypothetical protein
VCGFAGAGVLMTVANGFGMKAQIGRSCRWRCDLRLVDALQVVGRWKIEG